MSQIPRPNVILFESYHLDADTHATGQLLYLDH